MAKVHGPGATASIPIEAITAEVAAYVDDILEAVGNELLKEVKTRAATAFTTRKGRLIKSIKKSKSKFAPDTVLVKATDPKAHLIEHGHDVKVRKDGKVLGHAPAFPFMGPAEDAVRDRLPDIINNVVGALTIEVKS